MKKTDNAVNILTTSTYKGIGKSWIVKNLKKKQSIDNIVSLINSTTNNDTTVQDFFKRKEIIRNKLNNSYREIGGFGVTALGDDDFPEYRGNVKESEQPVVLFYRGNLSLIHRKNNNVSVIGLLTPDVNIEINERNTVYLLVKYGVTIVSGLALGCDSIAHDETLKNNGKTVAILPGSLNNILPKSNKFLAESILKNDGLLVTEYYDEAVSRYDLNSRYIQRDRLQALFSNCVILSASYARNNMGKDSGSRYAMEFAKKYFINRAVIYNENENDCNPMFDLTRQIIGEDSKVIIINKMNFEYSIQQIISYHQTYNAVQAELFS